MGNITNVSRRAALKAGAVGGLTLGISMTKGFSAAALAQEMMNGKTATAFNPDVFLSIEADGTVVIIAHRSEMGQGSKTGLPMIVAEELDADWQKVRIVQGEGDPKYGDQNTDGSRSVRFFFNKMRESGATARLMMQRAVARKWDVPVSDVHVANHILSHKASKRTMGFGEASVLAANDPVPAISELTFKNREEYGIVGKEIPVVDMQGYVTGQAGFGIDAELPGMLHAVIQRPPVLGGKVKSFNADAARKISGVSDVVEMPSLTMPALFKALGGVAVLGSSTWACLKGREALEIEWDHGPNASHNSDAYLAELQAQCRKSGKVSRSQGDVEAAFKKAAKTVEAEYTLPYYPHTPMEKPVALAEYKNGKMEVWAPVQDPQSTKNTIVGLMGFKPEDVTVNVTLLGGAFGRKSKPDFVIEAAILSKETGKPVKVTWTREDEIRHDYLHSISAQYLKGGLDDKGQMTAWLARTSFPSIGSTFAEGVEHPLDWELALGHNDVPFETANIQCESGKAKNHVRIGWLRSVANIHHVFAQGSFVDEMAHAAGRDTKDFLLDAIGSDRDIPIDQLIKGANYGAPIDQYPYSTKRLKNVLNVVCEGAGWGQKLPDGQGMGVAVHRSFLSYVAVVAKVTVVDGEVTVDQVDIGIDCGLMVMPERVRAQMEGSVIHGISFALLSKISIENGAVVEGNFDEYQLARIEHTPKINVHMIDSQEAPAGVGEPGVPPVAPAICNAIFAATGKRIRNLPVDDQLA